MWYALGASGGEFQSTLPVGGATNRASGNWIQTPVSIHAPRGGSDPDGRQGIQRHGRFNPRSPWGERRE